ncbi:Beta-2-glycoprotein 1 [Liparis tanakae]|uniref:Beta-2-glycoprotein 1 n=1 Tax=Liparis tanakae TaxID=230148 RepID=A0A4Z2F0V0_9TELE|nr:Beta-2-glycoprotein 1 [Liparis tanakae]
MERLLALTLLCPFVYFTTAASNQDNVCLRPELAAHVETNGLQRFFNPGRELTLSCHQGYTPVLGPLRIVCGDSGEWTKTKLLCIPVTCGLAPIPQFGMIIYDKRISGNTIDFGVGGTYKCLPPYVVIGNPRAQCTSSGTWTEIPKCQVVTCPTPENIDKGFVSSSDQREYDYMETVKYGCNGDYVIEGSFEIVCQRNGEWSEKPSCKAPCSVGIQKGRILYKGQKIWIKDLQPNKVFHKDIVSVYCMDKVRKCGYAVPTQCTDGRLTIPECFNQPSGIDYVLYSSSLPSEIEQC